MKTTLLVVLLLGAAVVPAPAQQASPRPSSGQATTGMSMRDADASPASKAFRAAGDKMMNEMAAPMSGDADRDFVAGMLPHHQGAVEMAKVELQYGKDAELRRLATGIVQAQEKEIAQMKAWQARRAVPH